MYSYLVEDTFVIEDVAVYFLGELEVMFVQNRAESKDGRPAKRLWFGHREKTTAPRGPIEEPWYSLTTSYQRKWINFALSMTYGLDTIYISSHLISSRATLLLFRSRTLPCPPPPAPGPNARVHRRYARFLIHKIGICAVHRRPTHPESLVDDLLHRGP